MYFCIYWASMQRTAHSTSKLPSGLGYVVNWRNFKFSANYPFVVFICRSADLPHLIAAISGELLARVSLPHERTKAE